MVDKNYEYIKRLSEANITMQKETTTFDKVYEGYCNNLNIRDFNNNDMQYKKICHQAMSYIYHIISKNRKNEHDSESIHCLYLYHWLYHKLMEKGKGNIIKSLFERLLKINETFLYRGLLCKDYRNSITEYELIKLSHLYNVYKCINTEDDEKHERDPFCNTIRNYIDQHDRKKQTEAIRTIEPITPAKQRQPNIAIPIVITIVTMIIIFLLLLVVHKYTPYVLQLYRAVKRKRNKWNDIYEDGNIFQNLVTSDGILSNSKYNILYNLE
ncbi:variable surface protein [Plasmodium gonderi]|uniref:Variable surface protein n=1 Tax=Plasmodium gonderi TaxID=77519 RepID=A0A1Y1JX12_PLAGO|nr:variable surface protein [Plasmodium gonderi]GAW84354.1 variable surface protein [Plasmodium gonderi]